MYTRATGKALGRPVRGLLNRLAETSRSSRTMPLFVLALWTACAGITGTSTAGAEPLPAFHKIKHVPVKKQRFFEYLTPVIRAENARIGLQRERLLELAARWRRGEPRGLLAAAFLDVLAHEYRVDAEALSPRELIAELLERVDVIPRSLVLAQAAKESGWGSSRFARHANNLFGQWCFKPGCGIVPQERPDGMTHEVRSFESVRESVASYMRNLNTHRSYQDLRRLRARLRAADRPLSGLRLAEGLVHYSERGDDYVREVQAVIRQNGLEQSPMVSTAVTGS